jgi:glutamine synthetase type III
MYGSSSKTFSGGTRGQFAPRGFSKGSVSTPAFNQETAADYFVKSKELKRETGNCANPNLPLHRTMRLAG